MHWHSKRLSIYAIDRLGEHEFETHLDRLSPLSKWFLIPKLITGSAFRKDSHVYEHLSWLFQTRNRIVHHKSVSIDVMNKKKFRETFVLHEDAEKSVKTVTLAVTKLKTIDSNVSTSWLSR